jgi:large subunit ribosomal protein L9
MDVILREDYISLGYIGDKVKVRRGFARNFLIPRGIAVEASGANERVLKHKLSAIVATRLKKKAEAEAFGKVLQQVTVELTLKVGAQGKSFGSITSKDIEEALKGLGYNVDRRQIRLTEVIKGVGQYKVEVKLHSEVVVGVQVKVQAAQVAAPVGDEGADKGKGRKRAKKKAASSEDESAEAGTDEGAEEAAADEATEE